MIQTSISRKISSSMACFFTSLVLISIIFSACTTNGQTVTRATQTPDTQNIPSHTETPANTLPPGIGTQTTNKVVPQGVYESCAPSEGNVCLDHLKQIAAGGFTLVVNYDQFAGTANQELAYARTAAAQGIKIIWSMSNKAFWDGTDLRQYYSDLATTCNCSDNTSFIRYMVNLVKDLPATWGYYVGDEVKLQNHDRMKAFADLVHQTDNKHPRLMIGDADTIDGLVSYLTAFADTAEVLGNDYYPIGVDNLTIADTGTRARAVQQVTDATHLQSSMVLQSFSLGQYPDPTCNPFPACASYPTQQQMRQMRDLTLNNARPALILWYSYFDIIKSKTPATNWNALIQAAGATGH